MPVDIRSVIASETASRAAPAESVGLALDIVSVARASTIDAATEASEAVARAGAAHVAQASAGAATASLPSNNRADRADSQATGGAAVAFDGDWPALARQLGATGLIGQFMAQSELIGRDDDLLTIRVPIRPLADAGTVTRVRDRLSQHFGRPVRLKVEVGRIEGLTAARQDEQHRSEQIEATREALEADPFVKTLMADFGGRILPDSVSPKPGA